MEESFATEMREGLRRMRKDTPNEFDRRNFSRSKNIEFEYITVWKLPSKTSLKKLF